MAEDRLLFAIRVDFSKPLTLQIADENQRSSNATTSESSGLQIMHLPPLHMTVLLPSEYPSATHPIIESMAIEHAWLSGTFMQVLCNTLTNMWNENEFVLALWVDSIQTGEDMLSSLDILKPSCGILQ